ncbi:MAG TPA: FAD-dependent oxidoreductase, partial [Candidatus Glassbacteria bacterium]|nr:FAD-dependent oxidoreductase [Candidatus Glassbacteria bacterium]
FLSRDVGEADFADGKLVLAAGGDRYSSDSVIIATGASPRMLGLENERKFIGRGVSTCATCDAFFYRGRKVTVVGGGDSAMEESSFISKFAAEVTLVHRRNAFRASQIMQERVLANEKIKVAWDTTVSTVLGDDKRGVYAVVLENVKTGKKWEHPTDGFFLAIGHTPNSAAFRGQVETDENGYIVVRDGTATSTTGVFAAGDVVDHRYRQAVTAAGMGCMASLDAEKFLAARG